MENEKFRKRFCQKNEKVVSAVSHKPWIKKQQKSKQIVFLFSFWGILLKYMLKLKTISCTHEKLLDSTSNINANYNQLVASIIFYWKDCIFMEIDYETAIFFIFFFSLILQDWAMRTEEQGLLIERILVLMRNVLHVPSSPESERRADNDASLHDQVLWSMHQAGILDLVLYIIGSEYENQYHLHALEIICLMYREQVRKLRDGYHDFGLVMSTTFEVLRTFTRCLHSKFKSRFHHSFPFIYLAVKCTDWDDILTCNCRINWSN